MTLSQQAVSHAAEKTTFLLEQAATGVEVSPIGPDPLVAAMLAAAMVGVVAMRVRLG